MTDSQLDLPYGTIHGTVRYCSITDLAPLLDEDEVSLDWWRINRQVKIMGMRQLTARNKRIHVDGW